MYRHNDLYMYLKSPCIIRKSAISLLYLHVYICTAIGQYKMMAHTKYSKMEQKSLHISCNLHLVRRPVAQ